MTTAEVADEAIGGGVRRWLLAFSPRRSDYAGIRRTWRGDVLAGITVGVVALPLGWRSASRRGSVPMPA